MRTQRRNYRRRRTFESLENRHLLAGDVFVEVNDGGDLVVTGDDNNNYVIIEGTGVDGQYVVTGDDGTNIFFNGTQQPGATVVVSNADGSIIVDLNAGDDTLEMNNVAVEDDDIIILMDARRRHRAPRRLRDLCQRQRRGGRDRPNDWSRQAARWV